MITLKLLAAWVACRAWAVMSAAADLISTILDSTPTWARSTDDG